MTINEMAFLEVQLLSSQSEQFQKLSKSCDWLGKKPTLQKKPLCFASKI